jgi:hypothetical protein
MPHKTVGKIATDLLIDANETHSVNDQMRENLTEYDKNIYECIELGKKEYDNDFYIVVITKNEKLLQNVLRHYFLSRKSCPSPQYDEAVYKYHRSEERIEFLWVVPSKDTCEYFVVNSIQIPEEERQLLDFVLRFTNGDLNLVAKKMNGELFGN